MARVCGEDSFYADKSETERVWFYPGDEVPAWAAKQVGDHCLVKGSGDSKASEPEQDSDDEEPEAEEQEGPPPQSGAGASTDAWLEYAELCGVDVADDDGRDDIIKKVKKAGYEV